MSTELLLPHEYEYWGGVSVMSTHEYMNTVHGARTSDADVPTVHGHGDSRWMKSQAFMARVLGLRLNSIRTLSVRETDCPQSWDTAACWAV